MSPVALPVEQIVRDRQETLAGGSRRCVAMARDPNTPKAPRPKKKPKNKDAAPPPERNETPEVRPLP